MSHYFAQVRLKTQSGDLADDIVNTFAFQGQLVEPATEAIADEVADVLRGFYTNDPDNPQGVTSVSAFFSPYLVRPNGIEVRVYDLSDLDEAGNMGPPIGSQIANLTNPAAGDPLPSHIAAVLTLEGLGAAEAPVEQGQPPNRIRPKQRHRGRVYLGPFNTQVLEPTSADDAAPAAGFRGKVFGAFADMRDAMENVGEGLVPAVWSRANQVLYPLVGLSMDDKFDIVQSRKRKAGVRTSVAI